MDSLERDSMATTATSVTEQSFEEEVLQSDKPVIVDFWAEWCGPCHAVAPVLDRIVEESNGDLKLVKVNIDEQPALSQRFGVQTIPPPSQPPSVRSPKPITVSTNAPLLTLACVYEAWPKIAASAKNTVAESIAIMCKVAVFQSSVPRVIVNQSSRPVNAVGPVMMRPKISAIHQP